MDNPILIKLIKDSKLLGKSELKTAVDTAKHLQCSVADVILGRDLVDETEFGEILEEYHEVPFVDLKSIDIPLEVLELIPEDLALERKVISFKCVGDEVYVAMEDPKDLELTEIVRKSVGNKAKIVNHVATSLGIKHALKLYKQKRYRDSTEKLKMLKGDDLSVVGFIDEIINEAVREESSDIHFEPLADRVLVRYRVDGVLHDYRQLDKSTHANLVARIKILSDLKLDETRLPQDGQFSFQTKTNEKISLRVSVLPTIHGEKVVLRILQTSKTMFNLEELGVLPEDQEKIEKVLDRSHGMFLVTGPTGSGKTTTLYTALGIINRSDVNIVTVEDPVENKINRVNQTQTNSEIGLTFAKGLRSILRQDPDVIMVGEIRDNETAVISVNAAMTGHLVFSSVHANTSAGALPRMLDLGAEPFLVASTVNLVIAQRLVRVLCDKCKKEVSIDEFTKKKLESLQDDLSEEIKGSLKTNYEAVGCSSCYKTGYRGRIGVFEVLHVDSDIKEKIIDRSSEEVIWKVARKKGAKTMLEDGLIKVNKGLTSLNEVFRVVS